MIHERFYLREDKSAYFDTYIQERSPEMAAIAPRPIVVVCPGGSYWMCSDREAEPIALEFLTRGFQSVVVRYSVAENSAYPNSLVDVSKTIKIIREHAQEWGVNPDKIAVCGFSAGGHLVSTVANLWNDPEVQEKADCKNNENKPNAAILVYPVVTTGKYTHGETTNQILRGYEGEEREALKYKLSGENSVGPQTPPVFLAHTYMDDAVPVENSLMYARALADNDIPFDLHVFRDGRHGLALANENTYSDPGSLSADFYQWMDLCCKWLVNTFGLDNVPGKEIKHIDPKSRIKRD